MTTHTFFKVVTHICVLLCSASAHLFYVPVFVHHHSLCFHLFNDIIFHCAVSDDLFLDCWFYSINRYFLVPGTVLSNEDTGVGCVDSCPCPCIAPSQVGSTCYRPVKWNCTDYLTLPWRGWGSCIVSSCIVCSCCCLLTSKRYLGRTVAVLLITGLSEAQGEKAWDRVESALKWGCCNREDCCFLGNNALLNIFSAWSWQN